MSREHYAWGSVRRTGRQLLIIPMVFGIGLFVAALLYVFGDRLG